MKHLMILAATAVLGLAPASTATAQNVGFSVGSRGLTLGPQYRSNDGYNSYDRRLNRYRNNSNYRYRANSNRGRRYSNNYNNYDYYGGNRGRVRDYRNYYRANPNSGYSRWYNSRPGISVGNGRSGFYFSF